MKRRLFLFLMCAVLAAGCCARADDGGLPQEDNLYFDGAYYYYYEDTSSAPPVLVSLTHNCPSTGIMLPESFSPDVYGYLLTVASWVSRVSLTPVASDPAAEIRVNGTLIRSGSTSSYIRMDDKPQQVVIDVSNSHGTTRYTLFLQRRPSEKRTRVSAGQVNAIYFSGSGWVIDADLGTVTYSDGNLSTYINKTPESYKYTAAPNCIFYYGDIAAPVRAFSAQDFAAFYDPYALYRFIYIEDEIVAVLPYSPDY